MRGIYVMPKMHVYCLLFTLKENILRSSLLKHDLLKINYFHKNLI
jgi:hypothetical protein